MAESKPNGVVLETTLNKKGQETATTTFSSKGSVDQMYISPNVAIPVILVPGIMGSPLIAINQKKKFWDGQGKWAWFPDGAFDWVVKGYGSLTPAQRRQLLDPQKTKAVEQPNEVDAKTLGDFLKKHLMPVEEAKRRGWGSVMISSYGGILSFLETQLQFIFYRGNIYPGTHVALPHDEKQWGELKGYRKLTENDLRRAAGWRFPVYAVGYNWVDTNTNAAAYLKKRIDEIRKDCRERLKVKCDKVILVTHSMGGLVARMCAKNNPDDILGIVHGVQPAIGAGTAYARVRGGWEANTSLTRPLESIEEIVGAWALGSTAQEVMAVFANGAGPLELLPNQLYGSNWLRVEYGSGSSKETIFGLPKSDPYEEIYQVPNKWWRLIHPGVLVDKNLPSQDDVNMAWDDFSRKLGKAKKFHYDLGDYYHPITYAFCGADKGRKGTYQVTWKLEPLMEFGTKIQARKPSAEVARDVAQLTADYMKGQCYIRDPSSAGPVMYADQFGRGVTTNYSGDSYRAIMCIQDDPGDATVPGHSGLAPKSEATFFAKMQGFGHQGAYDDTTVQAVTLYSILHLAATAKPLS